MATRQESRHLTCSVFVLDILASYPPYARTFRLTSNSQGPNDKLASALTQRERTHTQRFTRDKHPQRTASTQLHPPSTRGQMDTPRTTRYTLTTLQATKFGASHQDNTPAARRHSASKHENAVHAHLAGRGLLSTHEFSWLTRRA